MFLTSPSTNISAVVSSSTQMSCNGIDIFQTISAFQLINNASVFNSTIPVTLATFSDSSTVFFEPPNFQAFFGFNAAQTATSLIINKSDLTGLTPLTNNTAESLLVGIINRILAGKHLVQFVHIDFKYWGHGVDGKKRIDTVLLYLYDKEYNGIGDISTLLTTVNPNDYQY